MSSPTQRSLAAQIAANERWGRINDRAAATAPARQGIRAKFAREVDPDGTMAPAEREKRIDNLVRAKMIRMSLAAAKARAEKKTKRRRNS